MTLDLHYCENCGKAYMPARYWQKFCTPKCRLVSYWRSEIPKLEAKIAAKATLDPLDDLLDDLMNPKQTKPSAAQEAEWQRHKALAEVEARRREEEDKDKAEKLAKQALEPESNAIEDWFKKVGNDKS
jgi:predicted  nucleic acid-binding Zn-ribbon protein